MLLDLSFRLTHGHQAPTQHAPGECVLGLVVGGVKRSRRSFRPRLHRFWALDRVLFHRQVRWSLQAASGIPEAHAPFGHVTALGVRRTFGFKDFVPRWSVASGGASANQDLVPSRDVLKGSMIFRLVLKGALWIFMTCPG